MVSSIKDWLDATYFHSPIALDSLTCYNALTPLRWFPHCHSYGTSHVFLTRVDGSPNLALSTPFFQVKSYRIA